MAGYRRVNYYELCRLCTSSEGTKMHIFREEGRRRQLPTKIQICLPLQVAEDDSLPKIICSHCVDKLESFYDFRESCVNAEAMLESYFTSLRYSNDFTREGKVYVKDESPPKKKAVAAAAEADKVANAMKPILPDGLNSLVQAAGIQIVTDDDGTRVEQYKLQVEMAGAVLDAAAAAASERYTYEPTQQRETISVDGKLEDGSTQCSETDFNAKALQRQQEQPSPESSDADMSNQHQPITFTTADPATNQMLVHFNFKQRVDIEQRSSISQIGEFLRIKSVSPEAPTINISSNQVLAAPALAAPTITCDTCHMLFNTLDDFQNHRCCQEVRPEGQDETCQDGGMEATEQCTQDGKTGNFACEICNKPFKRKEHLFQHRKLHSGERPYSCSACGKAFSRKEHLVRHAVSHTGQKTHACDLCGKAFSRKDNLHKHRKTHGIAGPYVCETCGKSFVVKHYYLVHQASHNGGTEGAADGSTVDVGAVAPPPVADFKCDICPKSFGSKTNLSAHKARHKKAEAAAQQQQQMMPHLQPLTTINNAALHGTEVAQVAFLPELIDQYRRLHST